MLDRKTALRYAPLTLAISTAVLMCMDQERAQFTNEQIKSYIVDQNTDELRRCVTTIQELDDDTQRSFFSSINFDDLNTLATRHYKQEKASLIKVMAHIAPVSFVSFCASVALLYNNDHCTNVDDSSSFTTAVGCWGIAASLASLWMPYMTQTKAQSVKTSIEKLQKIKAELPQDTL